MLDNWKISDNEMIFFAFRSFDDPEFPGCCTVAFFRTEDDLEWFLRNNLNYVSYCEPLLLRDCGIDLDSNDAIALPGGTRDAIIYSGRLV